MLSSDVILTDNLNSIDSFFSDDIQDKCQETNNINQDFNNNIIVGIDLGTTNSCIAVWRNNCLEVIPDQYGNRTVPSIVSFTSRSKYVGLEAKKQLDLNPSNTYYEVKRLIGRKLSEEDIQRDISYLSYTLTHDDQDNILIQSTLDNNHNNHNIKTKVSNLRKKSYTPEEISSFVLLELKYMAENYLKQPVTKAVITTPAYFNDSQRQATRDAATLAGLECVRIINEPTSAALAYGINTLSKKLQDQELNILVYDLGGGTLDCSILKVSNCFFEVLASTGNTHLGGADFDNKLVEYCINEFFRRNDISNISNVGNVGNISPINLQKLRLECENCKKLLSVTNKASIIIKDFYIINNINNDNTQTSLNLNILITRDKFEELCKELFILCLKSVEDVLLSANLTKDDIQDIILVGGATRIPKIKDNIALFFNKQPNTSVNPDEVVAAGAAIQGYILSHSDDAFSESITLLDIVPLSIGVETVNSIMNVVIPRNSTIPIKRTKKYTTASDYADSVDIKIYEGERSLVKDNFLVGEFSLKNLEKLVRGGIVINITFNIDINGIITINAVEDSKSANKTATQITITGNKSRLTKEQIDKIILDAKDQEIKDKIEREKKHLAYFIEDMCSNITLNIANKDFKIKDQDKSVIQTDVNNIYKWLSEVDCLNRSTKELNVILDRIKQKYSTLIIKTVLDSVDKCDIKSVANKNSQESVNIYDNDNNNTSDNDEQDIKEDSNEIYEKIENKTLGIDKLTEDDIKVVKAVRNQLLELCNNINDILTYKILDLDDEDESEAEAKSEDINKNNNTKDLKDLLDDTLLWAHVKENIKVIEYQQKIDEINKLCENINVDMKIEMTKREELEQVCFTLKASLSSNMLNLTLSNAVILEEHLDNILNFLIEEQQNVNNTCNTNNNDMIYQEKINSITELCNKLETDTNVNSNNNNSININITESSSNILDDINKTELDDLSNQGTSLSKLKCV